MAAMAQTSLRTPCAGSASSSRRAITAALNRAPSHLGSQLGHYPRSTSHSRAGLVVRAAYVSPATQAPPGTQKVLNLELPTASFQQVSLTALRRKRGGTAILVQDVPAGSAAAAAGMCPGQQLLAVSDPIRANEVWELNGLASLKYVKQAVDGRALDTINVRLTGEPLPEWQQAVAAARQAVAEASGGSSSEGEEELSAAEKAELLLQLERMNESAQQRKTAARQEKLDQRAAYELDNQEKKRSSTPFFAAFIVLFLLVPAGIVVGALASGYLDTLGPR